MSYILTAGHIHFDLISPTADMVNIFDIATSLSKICRFTGHTNRFYSVAEHCIHASKIVSPHFALEALLHDAQEAYVGDVISPLKQLLPDYRKIEDRIESVIREKFSLPAKMSPEVKLADLQMLKIERKVLGLDDGSDLPVLHGIDVKKYPLSIHQAALSDHGRAALAFIERFEQLTGAVR